MPIDGEGQWPWWRYSHWFSLRARAFRFWWQRRTRGWDDSEVWNLDVTIATFILPRLRRLKEIKHGAPSTLYEGEDMSVDDPEGWKRAEQRWDEEMNKMLAAFELLADSNLFEPAQNAIVLEGLQSFARHYGSLWD